MEIRKMGSAKRSPKLCTVLSRVMGPFNKHLHSFPRLIISRIPIHAKDSDDIATH